MMDQQTYQAKVRRNTTEVCRVMECDRPADGSRGWCWPHYMRWYSTGVEPSGPVRPIRSEPEPCAVECCDRRARIGDMCSAHARRARRASGDPGPAEIEVKAGHGKGKKRFVQQGYVMVRMPWHPNAQSNGLLLEHQLVMSRMLGRPLLKHENVHHRNGDRTDNRPENLELWSTHQPKGQRVTEKLAWAREIIDLYGDLPNEVL